MAVAVVPEVTCLYGGGLGLLALFLSVRTVRARRATIFTKHGDPDLLEAYNKSFANFTEYVPITLVMLALLEARDGVPAWLLHGLGATFLAGRSLHAFSGSIPLKQFYSAQSIYTASRMFGMVLTYSAMIPLPLLLLRAPVAVATVLWLLPLPVALIADKNAARKRAAKRAAANLAATAQ